MSEPIDNAIKGTPLEEMVKTFHIPSAKEIEQEKRISELEEELAAAKQDLQDAQDRLEHLEPVFAMAKDLSYHQNPYLQGAKQVEIAEWFRRKGYKNYFEEQGL